MRPVLLLALLVAACDVLGPDRAPPARLLPLHAVVDRDPGSVVRVPSRVVNAGSATLYLARCGADVASEVQRWEDGRWRAYSGAVCHAVLEMSPMLLAAGEQVVSVRGVREPTDAGRAVESDAFSVR